MTAEADRGHRSGMVAIVGRPNVGKSTLLNRLLGQKISIVTHKPQTTRHRILGIVSRPDAQIVFMDTPGLHRNAKRTINEYMNRTAADTLADADLVLMVVEAMRWTEEDDAVLDRIARSGSPVGLIVNKVDRVRRRVELLPFLDEAARRHDFDFVVPLAARSGDNLDALGGEIAAQLPEGPPLFPDDQITDRSERFLAAELIREKLTVQLQQEIPYALAVEVERFERTGSLLSIGAVIWVEREGQKAIVIGRGGERLKSVGRAARLEITRVFDVRVHLDLWVRVRENWSDHAGMLRSLGYD